MLSFCAFKKYLGDCSACVPIHAILFLYDSDGWDDVGVVVCSPDVKHNADDDLVASPERPALAGFEPWVVYTSPGALQPEQTFASEGIPRRSDIFLGAKLPKWT
jgi:hypothetical protein